MGYKKKYNVKWHLPAGKGSVGGWGSGAAPVDVPVLQNKQQEETTTENEERLTNIAVA